MAEILNTGRNKIAIQQGNSLPLNVAKFVFANIPGLVVTDPVNLAQGMPAAGNIVFDKAITAQGYVAQDQVVYSVILVPDEGDFTFNWVGLVDTDNVLIAVGYTAPVTKYKTVGLNVGNTLTRNFLLQFNNAVATTGITVSADAWQIDFIGRLNSMDESLRADMRDVFGDSRFIGNGMLVSVNAGVVSAKAGVGYVGGYRAVLAADTVIAAGVLPKDIYIDCMLEGGVSGSTVITALRASAPGAPLVDFIDGNNKKHYVVKIAAISAASAVTDLRKTISNTALIDYLLDLLLEKAPLVSPALTGLPTAPTAAAGANNTQLANTAFVQAVAAILAASIATKAPLNSPAMTGIPTLPTAAPGTNNTQGANTEFVQAAITAAINALVASAPGALDTLKELATALGNDPNFRTTMLNLLAGKAPLSSPAFTDIPTAPTAPTGTNTQQIANTEFAQRLVYTNSLKWSGSAMSVNIAGFGTGFYLIKTNSPAHALVYFTLGIKNTVVYYANNSYNGSTYVLQTAMLNVEGNGEVTVTQVQSSAVQISEVRKIGG